jgi:hypothetical protein
MNIKRAEASNLPKVLAPTSKALDRFLTEVNQFKPPKAASRTDRMIQAEKAMSAILERANEALTSRADRAQLATTVDKALRGENKVLTANFAAQLKTFTEGADAYDAAYSKVPMKAFLAQINVNEEQKIFSIFDDANRLVTSPKDRRALVAAATQRLDDAYGAISHSFVARARAFERGPNEYLAFVQSRSSFEP